MHVPGGEYIVMCPRYASDNNVFTVAICSLPRRFCYIGQAKNGTISVTGLECCSPKL